MSTSSFRDEGPVRDLGPGLTSGPVRPFGPEPGRIFANYARTALLLGALTVLVVVAADWFGGTAWAVTALVGMGVANLASWYFSDRIVVAMHRARPLAPHEAPQVHAAVERLSRRAGVPMPRIVYVPDPAPNAFATGRNPQHAVVAVTHGLLAILDEREIEGVLAHELSHVINRDVLIATIAATMAGAVSLFARLAGYALLFGSRGGRDDDRGGNPLGALLLVVVAPLIALLLHLAVSRSREYAADATGARLAGSPDGLARALAKLESAGREIPMRTADPATAHLYIVQPMVARASAAFSIVELFSTHPSIDKRIARLRGARDA